MKYGAPPHFLGLIDAKPTEFVYSVYLPIKIPGSVINIPHNLEWTREIVDRSMKDYVNVEERYIYLTAKHFFVEGYSGNREGWHSDGFMSSDINYIWCDNNPTEFCCQEFNITQDHVISLIEMERQAREENIIKFQEKALLKLTQEVIHRVPFCSPGVRSFVKVSISKDQYNLKGNAINPNLDYNFNWKEREEFRNDVTK